MEKLILVAPYHLELKESGRGLYPDSYYLTEAGLRTVKNYIKEIKNEQDTKIYKK
jgi:hypothetical protein